MNHAIIIEKYADGTIKTMRSTAQPPPPALFKQAKTLDLYLAKTIRKIEEQLKSAGLIETNADKKSPGNVKLWHAVGKELGAICDKVKITGRRERRWLWEAIENLYASERIKRAKRERTRLHFEYCYRLSNFPISLASKLNWSEWVYFFDSPTVREEGRIDIWLRKLITSEQQVSRALFRRFTENLNKRIKRMDTTVLNEKELFAIYQQVWKATAAEIHP